MLAVAACLWVADVLPPRALRPARPLVPLVAENTEGATIALARVRGRTLAFVADEDDDAIHTVDVDDGRELARTDLPGAPARILVHRGKLLVTLRRAHSLAVLGLHAEDEPLARLADIATADEPIAVAAKDDRAWVASGWGRTLEGFDLAKGARFASIPLGREPRALALDATGTRAFVGYLSESRLDVVDLGARAATSVALTAPPEVVEIFPMRFMKAPASADFAFMKPAPQRVFLRSSDHVGRQAYALVRVPGAKERFVVPHLAINPGDTRINTGGYGGGSSFAPTLFDLATVDASSSEIAHNLSRTGCHLPREGTYSAAAQRLYLACAGDDRVVALDLASSLPKAEATGVQGASAVATMGDRVVAWSPFERTLRVYGLELGAPRAVIALSTEKPLDADVAAGRKLFFAALDRQISGDDRACASCHAEGRDDGLVWPTPNGPRQTIFLAGRIDRDGPFGWDAEHGTVPAHVDVTVQNLSGMGLVKRDREKLAAYLRALPAPPRRNMQNAEIDRGRALFASDGVGCASCHDETTGFTDGGAHDVKSAVPNDRKKTFLAPSLRYLSGTAPYFHDGRYASLDDLVRGCDGSMGSTTQLGEADVRALTAYLRSL